MFVHSDYCVWQGRQGIGKGQTRTRSQLRDPLATKQALRCNVTEGPFQPEDAGQAAVT